MGNRMENMIFNKSTMENDENCQLLLSQYSLFVNMANEISNRRHANNVFFLSLHTLIVSGLTIFISNIELVSPNKYIILASLIAGITFSVFWRTLIK